MRKVTLKQRFMAMALSFTVFMAFAIVATKPVDAASKTKTKYVVTEIKETENDTTNGNTTTTTTKTKNTYKDGLLKVSKSGDIKITYSYNSKGYETGSKTYSNGKLIGSSKHKVNKNGDVTQSLSYSHEGSKKTLESKTTYKYWKKGVLKKVVNTSEGFTMTSDYDKNGNPKKMVTEFKGDGVSSKVTTTYKNTVKKGKLVKQVATTTSTFTMTIGGRTDTSTSAATTTRTYKYKGKDIQSITTKTEEKENGQVVATTNSSQKNTFKSGRVVKSLFKYSYASNRYKSDSTSTTTYKYKKVKVPQKYWKALGL